MPSSLYLCVLVTSHFSGGGVSPVRLMKVARAGLTMVTFLSWMVNARTSSFIGRTLAGNRIGSTLRSVKSNNMLPSVFCLRTGVACCLPTCAQGSSVPVMGNALYGVFFGLFGFSLVSCAHGES